MHRRGHTIYRSIDEVLLDLPSSSAVTAGMSSSAPGMSPSANCASCGGSWGEFHAQLDCLDGRHSRGVERGADGQQRESQDMEVLQS